MAAIHKYSSSSSSSSILVGTIATVPITHHAHFRLAHSPTPRSPSAHRGMPRSSPPPVPPLDPPVGSEARTARTECTTVPPQTTKQAVANNNNNNNNHDDDDDDDENNKSKNKNKNKQ